MVTLSLFRHAKSAWNTPGLGDIDRPLAPRGQKAAPRIGTFMADNALEPDFILCSSAVRARQTIELALPAMMARPDIEFTDALYHAGPGEMLKLVRSLPAACNHAMLVAHNPGMHALALELSGGGDPAGLDALHRKFPTAGLAVIDFDCSWWEVAPGAGRLRVFTAPRALKMR